MTQEMAVNEGYSFKRTDNGTAKAIAVPFADAKNEDEVFALKSYVDDEIAKLNYQKIAVSSMTISPSQAEHGSTFSSNVTLAYSFNREPYKAEGNAVTLTGSGTIPAVSQTAKLGSVTITGLSLTDATGGSWTLTGHHESAAGSSDASQTKSLSWFYRLYNGVGSAGATINAAFIAGLTKQEKASVATSFTVNAGAGQKIYFACPTNLTPHFYFGGSQEIEFELILDGDTENPQPLTITGVSGGASNVAFHVYRSGQANLGSTTIEVKAS